MREARLARVRNELSKIGCDAFLVTNPAKVRYLTGFNSMESSFCLVTEEDVYLIVGQRDAEKAVLETSFIQVLITNRKRDEAIEIRKLLKDRQRICFENDLAYSEYHLLKGRRSSRDFFPISSDFLGLLKKIGLIDKISAVKEAEEIRKIEMALRITEEVLEKHILPQIIPGITEADLAAEISYWGRKLGAEKDAFDIIVLSGKRSSMPHGEASVKNQLHEGDIIQFDFGHVVEGYPSDFSRVFFLGEPTEKQKEIYNLVLTAQEAAIKAAKPGIKCSDLDKTARDIIKSGGYDIPHALGHGLGILIHTFPMVGPGEEAVLEPGYVITIEPGVYIPDWGGIRLEDVVVITQDGCRNLTKFTKDLKIIPLPKDRHQAVRGRPFTISTFRKSQGIGTDPTNWGFSPS